MHPICHLLHHHRHLENCMRGQRSRMSLGSRRHPEKSCRFQVPEGKRQKHQLCHHCQNRVLNQSYQGSRLYPGIHLGFQAVLGHESTLSTIPSPSVSGVPLLSEILSGQPSKILELIVSFSRSWAFIYIISNSIKVSISK